MKNLFFFLAALFLLNACSGDDSNVTEDNRIAIENYLSANNLTAQSTASGLYYIIDEPGTGTVPVLQNAVKVTYSGYDLSGEVFDSGTITQPLLNLIQGWQEGIRLFAEGGSGKLLIPSHLAYGSNPPSNNQPIIFDITLLEVIE